MSALKSPFVIETLDQLLGAIWRLRQVEGVDSATLDCCPEERIFVEELKRSPYRVRGKSLDLWFRGHRNVEHLPVPGAFRSKQIGDPKPEEFYEETSACYHFMLRRPEYRLQCSSDFEWLALFQHYDGYTRLLDWSENAVIAAYFAVEAFGDKEDDADGCIYVLNAASLNEKTSVIADDIPQGSTKVIAEEARLGICVDTSPDVIMRAAQAFCRTETEWLSRIDSVLNSGLRAELRWLKAALNLLDEYQAAKANPTSPQSTARQRVATNLMERLAYPVAVFPRRSNSRLAAQAGMFTLHGGKGRFETNRTGACITQRPVPLTELAEKNPNKWLLRYVIPGAAKKTIREQLQAIGIYRATVYPEIQSDGKSIRELWCQ